MWILHHYIPGRPAKRSRSWGLDWTSPCQPVLESFRTWGSSTRQKKVSKADLSASLTWFSVWEMILACGSAQALLGKKKSAFPRQKSSQLCWPRVRQCSSREKKQKKKVSLLESYFPCITNLTWQSVLVCVCVSACHRRASISIIIGRRMCSLIGMCPH